MTTTLGDDRFPVKPGDRFGGTTGDRFIVEARAGIGGQAVVYRVLDTRLGRKAAVKISTAGGREKRSSMERFERELQLSARINHPHVLQVYDCGELPSGEPYVLLEWMERGSLMGLVERARKEGLLIPLTYVHYYAVSLGAAMRQVHQTQMVHRDIKPDNVLVAEDGVSKLTDFGIAKDISPEATPLTEVGQTLGTLGFMAPEQLSGLPGPQSDVFSYGVTIYITLTGKMPEQVSQNAIPLGRIQDVAWERVPQPFVKFLKRCTSFELDDRAQDFTEVLEMLRTMNIPPDSRPRVMAPGNLPPLPASAFVTSPGGIGPTSFAPAAISGDGYGDTMDLAVTGSEPVKSLADPVDTNAATQAAPHLMPDAVPATRLQDAMPSATRAFPPGSPRQDAMEPPGGNKKPLAIGAVLVLAAVLIAAVVLLKPSGGSATPEQLIAAVRALDSAAASGDWQGAKTAMEALPASATDTTEGTLIVATESLLSGRFSQAESLVGPLAGEAGELGARANLLLAASLRLGNANGYERAAASYGVVTGCSAPACGPLKERARTGLGDACAALPANHSACGAHPAPSDDRDRHLLASLVLLGDGHVDAAGSRLGQALQSAGGDGASCFEAAALKQWALSGEVPGALRQGVADAGQNSSRDAAACHAFDGLKR
jgi:eukaryotic-like serine/threonine-protein kinase